jgi:hypothetical protein
MMLHDDNRNECERFAELAAMATADALTSGELSNLQRHLRGCEGCHGIYQQYQLLAGEGFAALSGQYQHREANGDWDDATARRKLFSRISEVDDGAGPSVAVRLRSASRARCPRSTHRSVLAATLAACLVLGAGIAALRLLSSGAKRITPETNPRNAIKQTLSTKKPGDALLAVQTDRIAQLENEYSAERREAEMVRARLQVLERQWDHERRSARSGLDALAAGKDAADEQVRTLSLERDHLAAQLRDGLQSSQNIETELASLRADRNKALLDQAELEARVNELTAANQDQARRLAHSEQYLSSDRDIRELMGARNLYIADVFDVDSSSRTRPPFGRVFYTQGKSLIFYAFDLDRQPRLRNASAFQVWGQKETTQDERSRVMDLGILYLDSESNRRWILRFDDPRTLAEIDAVFVTVEPHGGSVKPTGKPFLFAMLRREANHP